MISSGNRGLNHIYGILFPCWTNEIIVFAPTRDKAACESYDAQLDYPVIR